MYEHLKVGDRVVMSWKFLRESVVREILENAYPPTSEPRIVRVADIRRHEDRVELWFTSEADYLQSYDSVIE